MTASGNERFLETFRRVKMYSTTPVQYDIASKRKEFVYCILVVYTEKNSLSCKYLTSLYKIKTGHVFFMTYNTTSIYRGFRSDVVSFYY